jgi:hypothetical protein
MFLLNYLQGEGIHLLSGYLMIGGIMAVISVISVKTLIAENTTIREKRVLEREMKKIITYIALRSIFLWPKIFTDMMSGGTNTYLKRSDVKA